MILAYFISGPDNGSYMFESRKGPKSCKKCGAKVELEINSNFLLKKKKYDFSYTYDGYLIVSENFKKCSIELGLETLIFHVLPSQPNFYCLEVKSECSYDHKRRKTIFANKCDSCGVYQEVIGANPVFLKNIKTPVIKGVFRTDIEFGQNHSRGPLIIIGITTFFKLKQEKLKGFYSKEIKNKYEGIAL